MKHFFALLGSSALLAGCVAFPYDAGTVYYPAPAVSATISSGHHHSHSGNYPYYPHYRPSPYYQPPTYVTPAPIIVPPVHFNYNRNARPGMPQPPHPRHDGALDGHHRRDSGGQDWHRRDGGREGGRSGWRRDRQSDHAGEHFRSR